MKISKNVMFVAASAAVVALGLGVSLAGQGRGTPPAPPEPQAGHGQGKLVIWGDVVNFNAPGTPNQCVGQTRYKRGERIGFRMTAIDGATGEFENTAVMVAHVTYAGKTVDAPLRWRGVGNWPMDQYLRQPKDMWTGVWPVPADAVPGGVTYTVTATDRFGRSATFTPFAAIPSQLAIVQ